MNLNSAMEEAESISSIRLITWFTYPTSISITRRGTFVQLKHHPSSFPDLTTRTGSKSYTSRPNAQPDLERTSIPPLPVLGTRKYPEFHLTANTGKQRV
jgi:hypothetical protein